MNTLMTLGTGYEDTARLRPRRCLAWPLYNVKIRKHVSPVAGSFVLFF